MTQRQLEIERLNGDTALADRLEKQLRKAGASDHDGRPKILRALDLPTPPSLRPPRRGDLTAEHLSYILIRQLDILLSRDPGVRLGGESEDVHQMRVAVRRMRSVLRVARPLLKREWEEPLRNRLGWLGRQLSAARDLDVQIAHFKDQCDSVKPQDRTALDRFIGYLQGRAGEGPATTHAPTPASPLCGIDQPADASRPGAYDRLRRHHSARSRRKGI